MSPLELIEGEIFVRKLTAGSIYPLLPVATISFGLSAKIKLEKLKHITSITLCIKHLLFFVDIVPKELL